MAATFLLKNKLIIGLPLLKEPPIGILTKE
jgi:hypothetical protein